MFYSLVFCSVGDCLPLLRVLDLHVLVDGISNDCGDVYKELRAQCIATINDNIIDMKDNEEFNTLTICQLHDVYKDLSTVEDKTIVVRLTTSVALSLHSISKYQTSLRQEDLS